MKGSDSIPLGLFRLGLFRLQVPALASHAIGEDLLEDLVPPCVPGVRLPLCEATVESRGALRNGGWRRRGLIGLRHALGLRPVEVLLRRSRVDVSIVGPRRWGRAGSRDKG